MRSQPLLSLILCAVLSTAAFAALTTAPPETFIGSSDVIAVATVTAVSDKPDTNVCLPMQATLRVDRMLKGPRALWLTIRYPLPSPGPVRATGVTLKVGQQQLFFLQRFQTAYTPVGGGLGIRPAADADKTATAIDEFPVTITPGAVSGPLYFGAPITLTFTVNNRGRSAYQITDAQVEGFYYTPRMDPGLVMTNTLVPAAGGNLVAPGANSTGALRLTMGLPKAWQLFTPDTYLLAPVALRIVVLLEPPSTPGDAGLRESGKFLNVASAWVPALAGFPPPPEPGADTVGTAVPPAAGTGK